MTQLREAGHRSYRCCSEVWRNRNAYFFCQCDHFLSHDLPLLRLFLGLEDLHLLGLIFPHFRFLAGQPPIVIGSVQNSSGKKSPSAGLRRKREHTGKQTLRCQRRGYIYAGSDFQVVMAWLMHAACSKHSLRLLTANTTTPK